MLLFLLGCVDYEISSMGKDNTPAEFGDTGGVETGAERGLRADVAFNAMHQRSDWGAIETTCLLSLAFYAEDEVDEPVPGQVVVYPTEPGTCTLTTFPVDVNDAAAPLRGSGQVDAGADVRLVNDELDLALARTVYDDGEVVYGMSSCNAETWPFGHALAIAVDAPPDDRRPLETSALLPFAPTIDGVLPPDPIEEGRLLHGHTTDLTFTWTVGASPPTGAPQTLLVLRHFVGEQARIFEALACVPAEDGRVVVPAATLAQLTADTPGGDTWFGAQIDHSWSATDITTAWGDVRQATTMVTWGGTMLLLDASE